MVFLIVAIILGLFFASFALQNTQSTSLSFFNYRFTNVPVYVISAVSLLLGLLISWILSIIDSFSTGFAMRSKNAEIIEKEKIIVNLKKKIQELETEHDKHAEEKRKVEVSSHSSLDTRSWWERLRDNLRNSYA